MEQTEKMKPVRIWKCPTCDETFNGPAALGTHYKANPDHRQSKTTKKDNIPKKRGGFKKGQVGGPGRPKGSKDQSTKERLMVERFLDVIRLFSGQEAPEDDGVAAGIYKWCMLQPENMALYMDKVLTIFGHKLIPAKMGVDEKELRLKELEAQIQGSLDQQGGQTVNIIAQHMPIPNALDIREVRRIESKVLEPPVEEEKTEEAFEDDFDGV